MQGPLVDLVIFPRYTGLVGAADYVSVPVNVEAYSHVSLEAWRGALLGTAFPEATFLLNVEASHDGVQWETLETTTSPATTDVWEIDLDKRWLRVFVTLTEDGDDDVAISLYVTGTLTRRVPG